MKKFFVVLVAIAAVQMFAGDFIAGKASEASASLVSCTGSTGAVCSHRAALEAAQ